MGFISYCLSLSLYIMSSYLKRYSVLMNLILQMHAGQRSMCGVIVVDGGRSRSTCHGRDAYIHDHCLGYRHNFALFYQLLDNNLFTHHIIFFQERSLQRNLWPPDLFSIIYFQLYKPKNPKISRCNLFTFTLFYVLVIFYIYLYQISPLQVTVKGLTTPLSRWVQVFDCLCRRIDWRLACISYWI